MSSRYSTQRPLSARDVYRREVEALVQQHSTPPPGREPLASGRRRYPQSLVAQFRLLAHRNLVAYYRNTAYKCTRLLFGVILGLVFGSALWGTGRRR